MASTVRKTVEFDRDNLEWFEQHYPGTSFWWLQNELLAAFRNAHVHTPQHYAILGAQAVRELIESQIQKEKEESKNGNS